jgi:hypothetical protein
MRVKSVKFFNNEVLTVPMLGNLHVIRIYDQFQEGKLFILISNSATAATSRRGSAPPGPVDFAKLGADG